MEERDKKGDNRGGVWKGAAISSQPVPRPQGVKCGQGTSFIFFDIQKFHLELSLQRERLERMHCILS